MRLFHRFERELCEWKVLFAHGRVTIVNGRKDITRTWWICTAVSVP